MILLCESFARENILSISTCDHLCATMRSWGDSHSCSQTEVFSLPQYHIMNNYQSHSSLTPTGELATEFEFESSSQPDTLTTPEREKELCSKQHSERLDRIMRHALRESLDSVVPSLGDPDAGFASLVSGFKAKIKKKTGLYEELRYIPRDNLRFKSKISHQETEFRNRALTVQTTAEPVESNADIGVRLVPSSEFVRKPKSDLNTVTNARRGCNCSKVDMPGGSCETQPCHREMEGVHKNEFLHPRGAGEFEQRGWRSS
jgi:hypothetical protein